MKLSVTKIKHWCEVLLKVLAMVVLYFNVAILITAADKLTAAGMMGVGYAVAVFGALFLVAQFVLSVRAVKELFATKLEWMPFLLKAIPGMGSVFSLAVLACSAEQIISVETASVNFALTYIGMLAVILVFCLISYGFGGILQRKEAVQIH